MLKRCFGCLLFSCVLAGAVAAGEFTETTLGTSLGWKPSRCSKPAKLYFQLTDVGSCNAAVEGYNDYLLQVRTYRVCISEEAQTDAKKGRAGDRQRR